MDHRICAPAKTSHAAKRRKEETSHMYMRRHRVLTQNQGSTPQETPVEGLSVDSKFFGERNANLIKMMQKDKGSKYRSSDMSS